MFSNTEKENLLAVLVYAIEHGIVKSVDDAKVLLVLEAKLKQQTTGEEVLEVDGDDLPGSD